MKFNLCFFLTGKTIRRNAKNFQLSPATTEKLSSWFNEFSRDLDLKDTQLSEDGRWLFFGEDGPRYPANQWDVKALENMVESRCLHLERLFRKKDLQYESLQLEFREIFEMDDLTDDEGQDIWGDDGMDG